MKKDLSFLRNAFAVSIIALATFTATVAQAPAKATEVRTGIATLYARDPLAQSLCFRDGDYGAIFQSNEVRNRCSDINYNGYYADAFTVGVEGSREGIILDIGLPGDLRKKYGYQEMVGNGQGFASIQVKDGKLQVLQDLKTRTTQELKESAALFAAPAAGTNSVPVRLGNVYLMRLVDRSEKDFELMVKLIVVAHVPNESVTFRWQVL